MMTVKPASIELIKIVAVALGELNEKAVFIGGATVPFYLPEAYVNQARPTEDVDVVMEMIGRKGGWLSDEILRKKGFINDTNEGAPICRWKYKFITVDIISTDIETVGFTNSWYEEGVKYSIEVLKAPVVVKIFSLPYFIASKIEAFKGRGKNDYILSRDIEDIISVLEVSEEGHLEEKLLDSSERLRQFLKTEFLSLLNNSNFLDSIYGAVFNREAVGVDQIVINRMKNIVAKL